MGWSPATVDQNSRSFLGPACTLTCDLLDAAGPHVEQHGAVQDAGAQLEQAVQRQRGHVGFAPAVPAVLHVLLKLQPPEGTNRARHEDALLKGLLAPQRAARGIKHLQGTLTHMFCR